VIMKDGGLYKDQSAVLSAARGAVAA
jgi:hypothetical protein